jgi:hypothetical protein
MEEAKPCGRCKQVLPIECFYFRTDRQQYTSKCKQCFTDYQREYKSRPEVQARQRAPRAEWQKAAAAVGRKNISDVYIKKLLTAKTNIRCADIPRELVALKRAQITLTRLIKEKE